MEGKRYVLVLWESENMYSLLPRKRVVSGLDDRLIIGKSLPIMWGKDKDLQTGKIINIGSKKEMEGQEKILEKAAADLSFEQSQIEVSDNAIKGMNLEEAVETYKRRQSKNKYDAIDIDSNEVCVSRKKPKIGVHVAATTETSSTNTPSQVNSSIIVNGSLHADGGSANAANAEVGFELVRISLPSQDSFSCSGAVCGSGPDTHNSGDNVEPATTPNLPEDISTSNGSQSNDERSVVADTDPYILLAEKNKKIRDLELKLAQSEKQNRVFKKVMKQRSGVEDEASSDMEDIGNGVMVSKSYMDYLRLSYKGRASIFFRQLIFESGLFDLEEVAKCSLQGKWINRKTPGRPGLDPLKIAAAKAATILNCGLKDHSWEMAEFERKLKPICSDARKKFIRCKDQAQKENF